MPAGTIVVDVVANTGKFAPQLKGAGKDAMRFGNTVQGRLSPELATLAKRFLAVGAAIAIARKAWTTFQQSVTQGAQIAAVGERLGIAPEQLQRIQFAATQANVSIETLNMGVQRSTRRIAEAAKGQGEAVKALKELNLSASELVRLAPDQQLRKIARAFEGVENQADKVRLAMKLFDSEGVALLQTFKDLEQNMARAPIISDETIQKLAEADRQLENIKTETKAVTAELSGMVAPVIIQGLKDLTDTVGLLGGALKALEIDEGVLKFVARGTVGKIKGALEDLAATTVPGLVTLAPGAKERLAQLRAEKAGAGATPEATTRNRMREFQEQILRLKRPFEEITVSGDKAAKTLERIGRREPFATTLTRGSQAELRARFQPGHQRRMEMALKDIAEKADRRDEILAATLAKAGIEVSEFSF